MQDQGTKEERRSKKQEEKALNKQELTLDTPSRLRSFSRKKNTRRENR